MDFYINLKVNFRGNSKNFLLSGSETKSWESMEAMVKRSFGLCGLQLTYIDEEDEEVSINSRVEYEEALKSAARQGNRLHMNVYETRSQPARISTTKPAGAEPKRGFRPPQHCPTLAQVVSRKIQATVPEPGMMIMKDVKGNKEEDKVPPAWFTSYMEKFKDQVVREAVDKICREFSGQCCIHKPLASGVGVGGGGARGTGGEAQQIPEVSSSTLPGGPFSSTPTCSSCRGQTTGGGYQCSVCTSCILCESCSYSHDPSHNLVRARTPLSIPERGSPAPDHSRFYRRGDRSFRKAEKQRLKAEKRLLKAEVKEIRKQLRMERRGIQWSSSRGDGTSSPVLLQPGASQHSSLERPKRPCPLVVPAMSASFLDENLPDGTRLRPETKFIKYWKMRNTGTVSWGSDTKLKFMWGNLAVGSEDRWREVSVPFLQPGQVGIVSVALCAPSVEGSYTSHWRLAHSGEQFGPRVWCSIVVDPMAPAPMMADGILVSPCVTPQGRIQAVKDKEACIISHEPPSSCVNQENDFIPSVDLLTAQDLLSFELLDINIVQELESTPNNAPADAQLLAEGNATPAQEKGKDDGSRTNFVCETVNCSTAVKETPVLATTKSACPRSVSPAHVSVKGGVKGILNSIPKTQLIPLAVPRSSLPSSLSVSLSQGAGCKSALKSLHVTQKMITHQDHATEGVCLDCQPKKSKKEPEQEKSVLSRSRSSSTSSEDYVIILPDCFDTSRPLVESMYSSALSQPGEVANKTPLLPDTQSNSLRCNILEADPGVKNEAAKASGTATLEKSTANDMLCTSQTLDDEPLTPEVVTPAFGLNASSNNSEASSAAGGEAGDSDENPVTNTGTIPALLYFK
ncbi:next to BRCA1 gene 1 protein [Neosynchiropus ocellatus]